jgi:manganese oxidase
MYEDERSPFGLIALFVAVATFLLATATAIAVATDDDSTTVAAGTPVASQAAPASVSLTEFAINPSEVVAGGSIEVTNDGTMAHDLSVVGTDLETPMLQPGESATLDISSLEPGSYEIICTVPGHEASGMSGTLEVSTGGGGGDDVAAPGGDHGGHGALMTDAEAAEMDQKMLDSIAAFPAETEGVGNQVLEPEVLPNGTKRFELTAEIVDWEVAPGEVVQAWTYNGMVPAPMIVLDVGDRIEVEVTNDLPLMTDIHWHGVKVPNDQDGVAPLTQDPIMPGETYTYEFTVTRPTVSMYHPHAHGDIKLPNGMFGAFIVGDPTIPAGRTIGDMEIPADLEVDQRLPMIVNDAGVIGLTLNGKSFPATEPIVAEQGDWIAIDYFNEGLQVHPMHLHGVDQLVINKDGHALENPYLVDTLNVAPGERYTVLVHASEPGVWAFHCHILNHAEGPDGMFGMVTAMIIE